MTFAHPLLLLLLAVPVLLVWAIPQRRAGLVLPFDHQSHPRRRLLRAALGAFECVPPLLLGCAIVLLAGPQTLRPPRDARELTNIQFAFDVSGSMMMDDRYPMAKEAVEGFIKAREGDAFGLTLFGSHQIRWTPLTKDLSAIRGALPFANPERQPAHMGGTEIGAALRFCRDNMIAEAERGDRMIILVSDGASSDLDGDQAAELAAELVDAQITLYHVHVARDDPIPPEVVEIAETSEGEAFQASDPTSLRRVFDHIDRMRPAKFKTVGTTPIDFFTPFALLGLAFLALHVLGLFGMRYTPW